jgi:hypothetical protein
MSNITYDVTYQEPRNRLTVAFRAILAIPHMVVSTVWGYFAEILAVVQWFIIVFTGKRNEGIWNLQQGWLGYYARVVGYVDLLFDQYPAFGAGEHRFVIMTSGLRSVRDKVLASRYCARMKGNTERLDRAFAEYLGTSEDSIKKMRLAIKGRLNRKLRE